jgi:hypothetical protein
MFRRRAKGQPEDEPDVEVNVDLLLEHDITMVEQAVDSHLQSPNESLRKELLAALEALHNQLARGDAYNGSVWTARQSSSVLGATSIGSLGEELPATEFQASSALSSRSFSWTIP